MEKEQINASEDEVAVLEETAEVEESLSDQVKVLSPTRLILKRFFRSKLSVFGIVTLIILFIFSFIGPLFSPWGVDEPDRTEITSEYVNDEITYIGPDGKEYILYDVKYDTLKINGFAAPSINHWLGTDQNGLDNFTRLI